MGAPGVPAAARKDDGEIAGRTPGVARQTGAGRHQPDRPPLPGRGSVLEAGSGRSLAGQTHACPGAIRGPDESAAIGPSATSQQSQPAGSREPQQEGTGSGMGSSEQAEAEPAQDKAPTIATIAIQGKRR